MSEARKPFAVYAITTHGVAIAARLAGALPDAEVYVSHKLLASARATDGLKEAHELKLPMGPTLAATFTGYDCHVFVISVGAVVRMIAPLIKDKKVDPAVVCVDDAARFAICVLSGHVGRGNAFAERVAQLLGATPVITTASDAIGTLTVDILGREFGWTLDDPDRNVTRGCAAVVNGAPVMFVQETGETGWWPADKPLPPGVRYTTSLDGVDPAAYEILIIATDRDLRKTHPAHWAKAVIHRPRSLALGVGCDKGSPPEMVARGVTALMERHGLSPRCVRAVGTIDKKQDEPAIVRLAETLGVELITYSAERLDGVAGIENPSAKVRAYVGTRGVAEPAALLAAGAETLLVPKQTYTEPGAGRSMTLAVARVPFAPRALEVANG